MPRKHVVETGGTKFFIGLEPGGALCPFKLEVFDHYASKGKEILELVTPEPIWLSREDVEELIEAFKAVLNEEQQGGGANAVRHLKFTERDGTA